MRRMALACLALMAAPATAEEVLVVRSNVPALEVGRLLDGKTSLDLPAGTQVLLMTAQGRSISLAGPYAGSPAPDHVAGSDAGVLAALSGLAARGGVETSALGAYRNPPLGAFATDKARLSKAGDINPFAQDNQCAIAGKAHVIRVKYLPKGGGATLQDEKGPPQPLDIKDGRAPWPAAVPMVDGATYAVVADGSPQPGRFTLRLLGAEPANETRLAAELARSGCDGQARVVVSGMIRAATETRQ